MSSGSALRLAAARGQENAVLKVLDGSYSLNPGDDYNMIGGIPKARVKTAIDSADSHGKTALWWAASKGQAPMVRLLIKRGASVNVAENKRGSSALIVASAAGHVAVVRALMDGGADVNFVNNKGNGAIHVAGSGEVAKLLLASGAVPSVNMVSGVPAHPTAIEDSYRKASAPGGPPRGNAVRAKKWMPSVGQMAGASRPCHAIHAGQKFAPPGQALGLYASGNDRWPMTWSSEMQPSHGRSAVEVLLSLDSREAARVVKGCRYIMIFTAVMVIITVLRH
jgi:hypothetical protein